MHRFAFAASALLVSTSGCASHPPHTAAPLTRNASANLQRAAAAHVIDAAAGLALFIDEQAEANAMLAAWAREHGLGVVDPAVTQRVLARARAGQDARTGEACGRPLGASSASERWEELLGTGTLHSFVSCENGACTLEIEAHDGGDSESGPQRWAAAFDPRAPWRDGLRRALAAAVPHEESEVGGFVHGVMGTNEPVAAKPEHIDLDVRLAHATGEWASVEDGLTFPGGDAPLRACFTGEGYRELFAAIDERGRVARCESSEGEDVVTHCACAAFVEHAAAAAKARGKRVIVSTYHAPADVVTPSKAVVKASVDTYVDKTTDAHGDDRWNVHVSDPAIRGWSGPPADSLARCFADATAIAAIHVPFDVTFDRAGKATSATIYPGTRSGASAAQLECTRGALLQSTAPCPSAATSTARGAVLIKFLPIGRPPS